MTVKLGPRPKDFDEANVRASPTFQKWMELQPGQVLRYACRDHVKGYGDDEERLMRRIMIARRNNLKDHAMLKRARDNTGGADASGTGISSDDIIDPPPSSRPTKHQKKQHRKPKGEKEEEEASTTRGGAGDGVRGNGRRIPKKQNTQRMNRSDEDIVHEMDVEAVEATRTYQKWAALPMGATLVYNHTYIKGKDDHDWLLRKNIWRRMRYRRQNRDKVHELNRVEGGGRNRKGNSSSSSSRRANETEEGMDASAAINTHARSSNGSEKVEDVTNGIVEVEDESTLVSKAVRDAAAVAQLELGLMQGAHSLHPAAAGIDAVAVAALDDPMVVSALDAAAQLAASSVVEVPLFGELARV